MPTVESTTGAGHREDAVIPSRPGKDLPSPEHRVAPASRALLEHLAFARDDVSGRMVDVRDVPRGSACHCSCVSCGEPLIARHGDIVAWHFAHKPTSKCSRPGVAGALDAIDAMVRQLLEADPMIELPSCVVQEHILVPETKTVLTINCPVAPVSRLRYFSRHPVTGSAEAQAGLSFLADFAEYRLGIILSREAALADSWRGIADPLLGVTFFDLSYPARTCSADGTHGVSIERLVNWLSHETAGKTWVQHPREPLARAKASRRQVATLRRAHQQPGATHA